MSTPPARNLQQRLSDGAEAFTAAARKHVCDPGPWYEAFLQVASTLSELATEGERLERELTKAREQRDGMERVAEEYAAKVERLERELADEWRRSEVEARKLWEVQGELMRLQMRVIEPLPPHERGPRPFGSAMELLERSKTMDEPEGKP